MVILWPVKYLLYIRTLALRKILIFQWIGMPFNSPSFLSLMYFRFLAYPISSSKILPSEQVTTLCRLLQLLAWISQEHCYFLRHSDHKARNLMLHKMCRRRSADEIVMFCHCVDKSLSQKMSLTDSSPWEMATGVLGMSVRGGGGYQQVRLVGEGSGGGSINFDEIFYHQGDSSLKTE